LRGSVFVAALTLTTLLALALKAHAQATTEPTTMPATTQAAAEAAPSGPSMGFSEDPSKGIDPSGLDFSGTLYKPNAWLGGWSAGAATKNDGSDFQGFGVDEKGQPAKPTAETLAPMVAHAYYSINFTWALVAGFLVMFMQAGFALVETGLCRGKNAAHTMAMNFMVCALGMAGFVIRGYALLGGGADAP